ncbi:MAG TPA: CDP-diacylglycerol--serine O-phosphatidyltransferase [Gemmatimonadaceae bacterium]|nr:CDP-diacylglycerol--serine O-phosphatidyltransferase [Gemmatimonadaceae bacterium]
MKRARFRRPEVKRAVVLLPNGFTLFNLFCGIYAVVLASRGRFGTAAFFIVLGGVADSLDGRIARATGTGSRFGEELDSLVDAISFGLAPALIMYFAALKTDGNDWIYVFIFASCAVIRLARFNVEQAGRAKTHFHGLPSPAAGMTLATYYWFSQTSLYNDAIIFFTDNRTLAELPWHTILRWLMVGLAYFMISDVPYPAVPTIGYKSPRQIVGTSIIVGSILGLIFLPREFIFPALVAYVLFGAVKWAALGFLDRVPDRRSVFLEEEADVDPTLADDLPERDESPPRLTAGSSTSSLNGEESDNQEPMTRRRRRRRRPRGDRPNPPANPPKHEDRGS